MDTLRKAVPQHSSRNQKRIFCMNVKSNGMMSIYTIGGGRWVEESVWPLSKELYRLDFLVDDNDADLTSVQRLTGKGAMMSPLHSKAMVNLLLGEDTKFLVWGGYNLTSLFCTNEAVTTLMKI
ncbi:uncharacterized protein [Ptychodera flava]|uniref:uncharacterized protein n=1 Tax=Ptychodera flava TaxID=63121 RepID=UPI00396A61FE